jgi:pimeloyl-ACP methyl ester carboxylesterase
LLVTELVTFDTEDGLTLDGLLRYPEQAPASPAIAVLYLHGKGGGFYTGPGRWIPESPDMLAAPWHHFAINMRMHHLGFSRINAPGRPPLSNTPPQLVSAGGGMWERIAEGILDVSAAVGWLRRRGYHEVFIVGKSSGGYYATQYAAEVGEITGVALLSPVHTHRMPFPTWFATDDEREQAIARARALLAAGQGHVLIPLPEWYFAISAASLVERADEPERIWQDWMERIDVPLLGVFGGAEVPDTEIWRAGYESSPSPIRQIVEVPDADHSYIGGEHIVATSVATFIHDVMSGRPGRAQHAPASGRSGG